MPDVLDRLRAELDQIGDKVQRGFEQGRLHLERARVGAVRDGVAKDLGLLVYQRLRGQAVDDARYDALLERMDKLQEELAKIERDLATVKGETVSVGEDPAPPTEPAEAEVGAPESPPAGGGSGEGPAQRPGDPLRSSSSTTRPAP